VWSAFVVYDPFVNRSNDVRPTGVHRCGAQLQAHFSLMNREALLEGFSTEQAVHISQ